MRRYSEKGLIKKKEQAERTKLLHEWFQTLWKKRAHYSEVSGQFLGHECKTIFFHHIMPKHRYPELEFDERNIILLTWDEHATVENNPSIYQEINIRREELSQL